MKNFSLNVGMTQMLFFVNDTGLNLAAGVGALVPEDEHEAQEGCVAADSLEPVVIDVEEHHLRLCGLQYEVSKLLDLQGCLNQKTRALQIPLRI